MVDSKIRKQIIDLISENFNATDLQGIYIAMGVDYDSLSSGGVQDRATELVEYLARRDRLPELLAELQTVHPNLPWPNLATVVSQANRLHEIPYPQNPNFTGREEILQQVAETLRAGQTTVVTQTIAGLGGVGKTQLALAYSYAHLDHYDLIYWLSANSEPGLGESMMTLARRLKLVAPTVTDQQVAVQAVQQFLSQTSHKWLLVYDNADQIEPRQLTPYLPRTGSGHVLITSRNPNFSGVGKVLELGLFTLDEAVEFLLHRRGAEVQGGSNEWQEAENLAEEVGRFPLALEHAAAYVESKGSSYTAYQKLFTSRQAELLSRAKAPDSYHATITTTWELAFDEVKKTPGALELLNLCCFLDPESIPLDLIKQITTVETQDAASLQAVVGDELALDDAIGALRRYSLIQRAAGKLILHQLVQNVARIQMGEERARDWIEVTVDLLTKAYYFDPHNMSTWAHCGNLIPHLTTATKFAEVYDRQTNRTAYLNNEGGLYLGQIGNLSSAKTFIERGAFTYEKLNGSNHPLTATGFNNLGYFLQANGDLAAAQPYLERALAIREIALGPDHPDTAQSLNNLGGLLLDMGELAKAWPYYERTLAIREKVLGADHPDTAGSVNNLGYLLQVMGDLAAARPYLERALAIRENTLGPDHPDTTASLNNLGGLLLEMGDLAAAQPYLERALAYNEKVLGLDHPSTAISLNNLGGLLHEIGDLTAAWTYLERALTIREKVLGPNHSDIAHSLNNLGMLLKDMGELAAAKPYLERALTIWEKALGPDHPNIATNLNNLAILAYYEGNYAESAQLMRQALAIREKRLGLDHPDTVSSRNSLAALEKKLS